MEGVDRGNYTFHGRGRAEGQGALQGGSSKGEQGTFHGEGRERGHGIPEKDMAGVTGALGGGRAWGTRHLQSSRAEGQKTLYGREGAERGLL